MTKKIKKKSIFFQFLKIIQEIFYLFVGYGVVRVLR